MLQGADELAGPLELSIQPVPIEDQLWAKSCEAVGVLP